VRTTISRCDSRSGLRSASGVSLSVAASAGEGSRASASQSRLASESEESAWGETPWGRLLNRLPVRAHFRMVIRVRSPQTLPQTQIAMTLYPPAGKTTEQSPAGAAVPSVIGLKAAEAKARMIEAGFRVLFVSSDQPAPTKEEELTIQRHTPAAGAAAPKGTRILLIVYLKGAETADTNVGGRRDRSSSRHWPGCQGCQKAPGIQGSKDPFGVCRHAADQEPSLYHRSPGARSGNEDSTRDDSRLARLPSIGTLRCCNLEKRVWTFPGFAVRFSAVTAIGSSAASYRV
jgi:hypothetical protein